MRLWLALLGGGILTILWLVGDRLLQPTVSEGLWGRVEQWAFWCAAIVALVSGYTTFEFVYRNRLLRQIRSLPVPPNTLFYWLVRRLFVLHSPLLLVPLLTGMPLLIHGHSTEYGLGMANALAAYGWGLSGAVFIHLWTGRSLLTGATSFKAYLAQGFGPPETAFLFYSPAMALLGTLCVVVLTDLSLRAGLLLDKWTPLAVLVVVLSILSIVGLRWARVLFEQWSHRFLPRFEEAEIVPPFKEGRLPKRVFGQSLMPLVTRAVRPLWLRNLRQSRRRFRIVVPLLVLAQLALVLLAIRVQDSVNVGWQLGVVASLMGVVFFTPAFRICGRDVDTRYDARALPISLAHEITAHWLLALTEWGIVLVVAGVAAFIAGGLYALWVCLGLVGSSFVLTNGLAIPASLRNAPRVGVAGLWVRGIVLSALGGVIVASTGWGIA